MVAGLLAEAEPVVQWLPQVGRDEDERAATGRGQRVAHGLGQRAADTLPPPLRDDEDDADPAHVAVDRAQPRPDRPAVGDGHDGTALRHGNCRREELAPVAEVAGQGRVADCVDIGGGHRADIEGGHRPNSTARPGARQPAQPEALATD